MVNILKSIRENDVLNKQNYVYGPFKVIKGQSIKQSFPNISRSVPNF